MTFEEFIAMGGYAGYIWSSYAIALLTFAGLYVSLRLQRKKLIRQLRRRLKHHSTQQN